MEYKNNLKTIRFDKVEEREIHQFIQGHPYIKSFSTLARAAIWEFLEGQPDKNQGRPPSFLWEYDLSHGEIREILRGPQKQRLWLVAKILEHGQWNEIWKYLSLKQIGKDLPYLRLPDKTKKHWQYALSRWRRTV